MRPPRFMLLSLVALLGACSVVKKEGAKLALHSKGGGGGGSTTGGGTGGDPPPLVRTPDTQPPATRADQIRTFLAGLTGTTELRDGMLLSADQITALSFNPTAVSACQGVLQDPGYHAAAAALGGFVWGYAVTNYRNERLPYFFNQRPDDSDFGGVGGAPGAVTNDGAAPAAAAGAAAPAAAPTIQRGDLIGRYGNYVVFLSHRFGLFFVAMPDQPGGAPTLSCSVLVPGQPINFYVDQGMLVLLVNPGDGVNDAAVLRFSLGGAALKFVDTQPLPAQRIVDSRLFNDTLAVYSQHADAAAANPGGPCLGCAAGTPAGGAQSVAAAPATSVSPAGASRTLNFYMLTVLQLGAGATPAMQLSFQESFPEEDGFYSNAWNSNGQADQSSVGKVVNASTYFNSFLSASGDYLAISKLTRQDVVTGVATQVSTWETCLNWNPHYQQVSYQQCTPEWQETPNPAYDPNFSCTDPASFDSCVQTNATKFVKATWAFLGNSCQTVSYWQGACTQFGQETFVNQYPIIDSQAYTELIIYRFDTASGNFTRLTSPEPLDLSQPFQADPSRVVVDGWLKDYKSINFQGNELYAVASHGDAFPWWTQGGTPQLTTSVQTFSVSGDAFVKTAVIDGLAPGESLDAVLFDQSALFLVTSLNTDPLFSIDLSNPAAPQVAGSLAAPGYSAQLIAVNDLAELIGLGTETQTGPDGYQTQRAKVSLYDVHSLTNLASLGDLTLGADADYSSSDALNDDQVYHYDADLHRLFVPFAAGTTVQSDHNGLVCWTNRYDYQSRLSITSMTPSGITAEGEVVLPQPVLRAQSYDQSSAIAFADAGVYHLSKGQDGTWAETDLQDLYATEGLYSDPSLPAGTSVAIQVKRNNNVAQKIRLALGTPDQLATGAGVKTIDLPDNITSCLGDPDGIRFLDNNVVFTFSVNDMQGNQQISYHTRFAYQVTAAGFTQLSDDQGKELENEGWTICYLAQPLPDTIDLPGVEAAIKGLTATALQCEDVNRLPYVTPILCDAGYGFENHGYCQTSYSL